MGSMSEETIPADPDELYGSRVLAQGLIATLLFRPLMKLGLATAPALMLSYLLVYLVGYWIGPRPAVGYKQFSLRVLIWLSFLLAGLWAIPDFLSRWLWKPIPYAIFAFATVLLMHKLPPVYEQQNRIVERTGVLVVIALVFGIGMSIAVWKGFPW